MSSGFPWWDSVEKRASRVRKLRIAPLLNYLGQSDNAHARALIGLPTADPPDQQSAHELEMAYISRFANGRLSRNETMDWLGLTYAGVKELERIGTALPPTRLSDHQPPVESPFAPAKMELAERLSCWRDAFYLWLRNHHATATRPAQQAAIVLSAMIHGALFDNAKLKLLLAHLETNTPSPSGLRLDALTFRLPYRGGGNNHTQRWIPDPVSAMLMYRLPDSGESLRFGKLLNEIRRLLAQGNLGQALEPKSVFEISQACATWWSMMGARVDVKISQRKVIAHAFADEIWNALSGQVGNALSSSPRINSEVDSNSTADEATEADEDLLAIHPWLANVRDMLKKPTQSEVARDCDALLDELSDDLAKTYVGWLSHMLKGKNSSRNPLKLSTIRERVLCTLPQLLNQFGVGNPANRNGPQLEDLYVEILAEVAPGEASRELAPGLRDFHDYLVRNCSGGEFPEKKIENGQEVFGDAALKPVDANVLTVEEYLETLAWIDRQSGRHWTRKRKDICKLVLILGFRCGLRRMEIFGARLDDIHCHVRLMALIRLNSFRRLKTDNSKREIPLFAFLNKKEQRFLKEWIAERVSDDKKAGGSSKGSGFLFDEFGKLSLEYESLVNKPEKSPAMTWADTISRQIIEALKSATGRDLHLHHLRHSFGTWIYLMLRNPDFPAISRMFVHLPKTALMLRRGRWLRRLIVSFDCAIFTAREYAFCVARLLGHSSPMVSFGHYIHSADIVLGAQVWKAAEDIPSAVLVAASGLTQSAAYKRLESSVASLVQGCQEKHRHSGSESASVAVQDKSVADQPAKSMPTKDMHSLLPATWVRFGVIECVLAMSLDPKRDLQGIAADQKLAHADIVSMLDLATQWAPVVELEVDGGRLTQLPELPRGDAQRAYLADIELKLAMLKQTNADLYLDGLELHLRHYSRQKRDALFQGKKDVEALRRYLMFLKALGVDCKDFQWVIRRTKTANPCLPAWAKRMRHQWWPASMKYIAPPAKNYVGEHSKWAGILPLDKSGKGIGKLFATAIYFAAIGTGVSNQNAANKKG